MFRFINRKTYKIIVSAFDYDNFVFIEKEFLCFDFRECVDCRLEKRNIFLKTKWLISHEFFFRSIPPFLSNWFLEGTNWIEYPLIRFLC